MDLLGTGDGAAVHGTACCGTSGSPHSAAVITRPVGSCQPGSLDQASAPLMAAVLAGDVCPRGYRAVVGLMVLSPSPGIGLQRPPSRCTVSATRADRWRRGAHPIVVRRTHQSERRVTRRLRARTHLSARIGFWVRSSLGHTIKTVRPQVTSLRPLSFCRETTPWYPRDTRVIASPAEPRGRTAPRPARLSP